MSKEFDESSFTECEIKKAIENIKVPIYLGTDLEIIKESEIKDGYVLMTFLEPKENSVYTTALLVGEKIDNDVPILLEIKSGNKEDALKNHERIEIQIKEGLQ